MELQGDILNLHRDKHLRAARLQWCLQELREREDKARRHNQQLLQDFHRAQDSLGEMVACTATMNTIRLEYERYLQENSPRWHQQLRENARASQKKRMDESLKRREEEQVSASLTRERFSPPRGNSLYRTARTTPTCNYDCVLQNTPRPQRAWSAPEDPCRARSIVSPTMPSSSRPSQAHRSHDALRFHSPTVVPQPGLSQVHRRTSPQQGPPTWGAPWSHWSPAWASNAVGSPPGLSTPWAPPPSTAGPSVWGLAPGRGAVGVMAPDAEGWGENRKSGSKCSSQELDTKPVRLSGAHGDSSDGGSDSGSGRGHRGRRKRREEGGQRSDSDRKSSSQESAGTSSADSEVKQTTSAARGRRVTEGQVSGAPSETESNGARRRGGGKSVQERTAERRTGGDPDHSGSHRETGRKTQKSSKSEVEESSGHMTDDDEDPSDQSEGGRKERGHQKEDSVSVGAKSERGPAAAAERVGEKAGEVQEDLGETDGDDVEPTDEDTSSENEDNEKDEEESRREENKEGEDKGREDGETEGQEQPGSSESESAASRSQAEEEQETNGFQTEIEDEAEKEEEVDEEEDGDGAVAIEKPGQGSQAGESEEESDSDDGIVSPQEHRENKPKSPDKSKVIKKDSFEESLPVESNKEVKMAEDTDDEFDHFYD
ncbi:unnamed protein product [Merluccius merluccius]